MQLIAEVFEGKELRIVKDDETALWIAQDVARELGMPLKNLAREIAARVYDDEDYVRKVPLVDSLGRSKDHAALTLRGLIMFIHSTPKDTCPTFKRWVFQTTETLIQKGQVTLRESLRDYVDSTVPLGQRYFAEVALIERQSNEDKDLAMTYLKKEISVLYKAASLAESALRASTKAQKDAIRLDLDEVLNALACLERGDVDWRAYADHLRQSAEFRAFAQTITDDPDKQNMLVAKMFAIS